MARKLALRTVNHSIASANGVKPPPFIYAACLSDMLQFGRGEGMSLDEVIRCVEALAPIRKAIEEGAEEVTLTDTQWQTVRDKLERFQFGMATPEIVEFGLMIRNAPEIGTT